MDRDPHQLEWLQHNNIFTLDSPEPYQLGSPYLSTASILKWFIQALLSPTQEDQNPKHLALSKAIAPGELNGLVGGNQSSNWALR